MTTNWLSKIDASIEESKGTIEYGAALERLCNSRDFKQVVLDGYLTRVAVALVHLKGTPENKSPEQQQDIQAQIDAIGHFNNYLTQIRLRADMAKKDLTASEQTREDLLSNTN